jgi:hypothetical protein
MHLIILCIFIIVSICVYAYLYIAETFTVSQSPKFLVHESVLNISDDFELSISDIFTSGKYNIVSNDDMRLCQTNECDVSLQVGNLLPGSLVEMYDGKSKETKYFLVRVKIVLTGEISAQSQCKIYIVSSPHFRKSFIANISTRDRGSFRDINWSNNTSEPDITFKFEEGIILQFHRAK